MRLADFEGLWQIEREITDHLTERLGRFDGQVVFEPNDERLIYNETGVLRLSDQPPMLAQRRYIWGMDGQGVAVFFEDGRPFHRIDLGAVYPTDSHDCPPDWYEVAYDFAGWPVWRAKWRVTGPRKDYTMVSMFRRG